jgi:hypothetical protein
MPVEIVPETDFKYYLIAFDEEGRERQDDPDGQMSQRVLEVLKTESITDVFLISHGWRSDVPAARRQYSRWIKVMLEQEADLDYIREVRPGFSPLLVGLHWPSLPWGNYDLANSSAISYHGLSASSTVTPMNQLVNEYATRLSETSAARQALQTILLSAQQNIAPEELPPEVGQAYRILNYETTLSSQGLGSSPATDREPFDPESTFLVARQEALSYGGFSWGGVLAPLRTLSFWKMKDRARQFGEAAGHEFLKDLQRVKEDVRFHLIGHSFGCIVLSGMLAGQNNWGVLERPVNSLFLIQGAFSHWSYCGDIPVTPGVAGYFHPLIAEGKVSGSIITTYSKFDTAVCKWYPLAASASSLFTRSVSFFEFNQFPMYGALGAFGARGGDDFQAVEMNMLDNNSPYPFYPGQIYNLDSQEFIQEGSGPEGAHNDIARREVAHAVWQAAIAS